MLFATGLVLLILGAELLVRGASSLASAVGLPPLLIGLTVVAFGTSAPELAVNVQSALVDEPQVALGNVVGSNIFNILFIMGLSALAAPLVVERRIIRREVPLMIGASFLLLILALDANIGRLDGLLLLAGMSGYALSLVWLGRKPWASSFPVFTARRASGDPTRTRATVTVILMIVAGLGLLVLGARWMVEAAVVIAGSLGLSPLIVGLTIVAVGTSLPEAATSVVASLRGERDIAVGNIVGSNLFNILGVLGLTGLIARNGVPVPEVALTLEIPVMIAVAAACLPIAMTGYTIARWEGAFFLLYYFAFIGYLILDVIEHPTLPTYGSVMKVFVIPLGIVTLFTVSIRAWRERRSRRLVRPPGSSADSSA